ncbi:MAG TPA: hypothetical protein VN577_15265 [Terriglobales bacterium]|nr:hypothetical protein [Terriglobales bacterium]
MVTIRSWSCALVVLIAATAFAVPIKPDLEKMLKQQEQRPQPFEPARAGWNGPEMVRAQDVAPNPVYEAYGPASTVREIRASLAAAATPDPKALVAIGILILLLRYSRHQRMEREKVAAQVVPIRPTSSDLGQRAA